MPSVLLYGPTDIKGNRNKLLCIGSEAECYNHLAWNLHFQWYHFCISNSGSVYLWINLFSSLPVYIFPVSNRSLTWKLLVFWVCVICMELHGGSHNIVPLVRHPLRYIFTLSYHSEAGASCRLWLVENIFSANSFLPPVVAFLYPLKFYHILMSSRHTECQPHWSYLLLLADRIFL